jgi:hypothetical protein
VKILVRRLLSLALLTALYAAVMFAIRSDFQVSATIETNWPTLQLSWGQEVDNWDGLSMGEARGGQIVLAGNGYEFNQLILDYPGLPLADYATLHIIPKRVSADTEVHLRSLTLYAGDRALILRGPELFRAVTNSTGIDTLAYDQESESLLLTGFTAFSRLEITMPSSIAAQIADAGVKCPLRVSRAGRTAQALTSLVAIALGLAVWASASWWTGNRLYWLVVICLIVSKAVLTADCEIQMHPADGTRYALTILNNYWFGTAIDPVLLNLGPEMPYKGPGMHLVAIASRLIGLPYYLSIQLLFSASAAFVAAVVRRTAGPLVALLVLAALLFNPLSISQHHDRGFEAFMSEPVLAITYNLLLFFLLKVFATKPVLRVWDLAGLGIVSGYICLVRPEKLLLYPLMIVAGALVAWRFRRLAVSKLELALKAALPLLCAVLLFEGIMTVNQISFGVRKDRAYAGADIRLLSLMTRIKVGDAEPLQAITNSTLRIMAEAGPNCRVIAGDLLNPERNFLYSKKENINTGNWSHSLYYVALLRASGTNIIFVDHILNACADELERAIDQGQIEAHPFGFPVDPNLSSWLPDYPRTLLECLHVVFFPYLAPDVKKRLKYSLNPTIESEGLNPLRIWIWSCLYRNQLSNDSALIDKAALRRATLVREGTPSRDYLDEDLGWRHSLRAQLVIYYFPLFAALAGCCLLCGLLREAREHFGSLAQIWTLFMAFILVRTIAYTLPLVTWGGDFSRYGGIASMQLQALYPMGAFLIGEWLRRRIQHKKAGSTS